MTPKVALYLCSAFVLLLLYRDHRQTRELSIALWIPLIWMLIISSRFISEWLNMDVPSDITDIQSEGSPFDRLFFSGLIIAGLLILFRRRVSWKLLIRSNGWVAAFFLFGLVSILWSDFPMVSLKRWCKFLGNVVMVLVILTETYPRTALLAVIRRCSFILIPFSVLLIKYFPTIGRSYSAWVWTPIFTGVATNKNALGAICVMAGLYFTWSIFWNNEKNEQQPSIINIIIYIIFLLQTVFLLYYARSATSTFSTFLGVTLLLLFRKSSFQYDIRNMDAIILVSIIIFLFLEVTVNIKDVVLSGLGRDDTLTGRTEIWQDVIPLVENPLIGTGFESFWLGSRKDALWEKIFWKPNQAHNGYLETYLHLGLIGLGLLLASIFSAYQKLKMKMQEDISVGIFKFVILLYAVLANITEASFKGINLVIFLFFLVVLEVNYVPENDDSTRDLFSI